MSHFRKGVPPCLPHRTGAPEGMGAEHFREGGAGGALLPLRDQEELSSMINHCCSFRRTLFFFLRTDTRAQQILYFLNSKTLLIVRIAIAVTAGFVLLQCFLVKGNLEVGVGDELLARNQGPLYQQDLGFFKIEAEF